MTILTIITIAMSILIHVDRQSRGRRNLEIPDFGAAEECLQLHRTG